MVYIGVDVKTRAYSASVLAEADGITPYLELANEESGWRTLMAELASVGSAMRGKCQCPSCTVRMT